MRAFVCVCARNSNASIKVVTVVIFLGGQNLIRPKRNESAGFECPERKRPSRPAAGEARRRRRWRARARGGRGSARKRPESCKREEKVRAAALRARPFPLRVALVVIIYSRSALRATPTAPPAAGRLQNLVIYVNLCAIIASPSRRLPPSRAPPRAAPVSLVGRARDNRKSACLSVRRSACA